MRIIVLLSIFFCCHTATSQIERYNRFSLAVGTGVHVPLSPTPYQGRSNYAGFGRFEIAARYMFDRVSGVRLQYSMDRFSVNDNTKNGNTFNKIGLEGTYSIAKLLKLPYRVLDKFNVHAHAGIGITFASPESTNGVEHIGNITIGIMPQYRISSKLAVYGDLAYVVNLKQHYNYNGDLLDPNYESVTGGFITLRIGLQLSLGNLGRHADWY